jgi:hypothetical protein
VSGEEVQVNGILQITAGGLVGFLAALAAGEIWVYLDRWRRKRDVSKLLRQEISEQRQRIERLRERALDNQDAAMFGVPLTVTSFGRSVYEACMAELALFPLPTVIAVHSFYHALDKLQTIYAARREMWLHTQRGGDELHFGAFLDAWFDWLLESQGEAIEAADEALSKLD